jgi:hypothetical protein
MGPSSAHRTGARALSTFTACCDEQLITRGDHCYWALCTGQLNLFANQDDTKGCVRERLVDI